jgi:heat-inducible transcriptional repressor
MLTERQSRILELVISEYVETATPVASQLIGRKYPLGASPATIRSEMAGLEELGYLSHKHTSSGRVPTTRGYRLYVERLMREEQLPVEAQRTIQHQFFQVDRGEEAWLHLAASILARAVQNAAVVTTPRTRACRLKHIELVGLHERTMLLLLVLDQGRVKQQIVALDEPYSQEELATIGARLNNQFNDSAAGEIDEKQVELSPIEGAVIDTVRTIMRAVDGGGYDEAYLEGLRHLIGQPEFADSERALGLLELLDERSLSRTIPLRSLAGEGVRVIIGADSPGLAGAADAMRECSVVIGSYGAPGVALGAVAVVGPTRMRYSSTVSTVRYLSKLLTELITEDYR